MKRKHYYVVGAIVFIIVGIVALHFMWRRTPERVLKKVTLWAFNISIEEVNPQIFSFEEEWHALMDDGYCKIGFRFDAPESFFRNFEKLPIKENIGLSYLPLDSKNSTEGYYLVYVDPRWVSQKDELFNFYILVFDLSTRTGYLYYQFI